MDALNAANNATTLDACEHSDGQLWQTYSDGTLRAQGGCLDVANGHTSPGTAAVWYPCNQAQSQAWQPKSDGELFNAYSGLCLTTPGDDTPLDVEPCTAHLNNNGISPRNQPEKRRVSGRAAAPRARTAPAPRVGTVAPAVK